ncbi:MAG: hypothetical protein FIA98_05935 [Anaerolineae bacterium]|nr:hypothetical protein [Anaerolineae bacterium]
MKSCYSRIIKGGLVILLVVCSMIFIALQPTFAQEPYPGPATATTSTTTQRQPTTSISPGLSTTPGATQAGTPDETQAGTPTTTLVPLPAITLVFPALTDTPTATVTPVSNLSSNDSVNEGKTEIPPRFRLLAAIIIILWLILAGFAIIFIHQAR